MNWRIFFKKNSAIYFTLAFGCVLLGIVFSSTVMSGRSFQEISISDKVLLVLGVIATLFSLISIFVVNQQRIIESRVSEKIDQEQAKKPDDHNKQKDSTGFINLDEMRDKLLEQLDNAEKTSTTLDLKLGELERSIEKFEDAEKRRSIIDKSIEFQERSEKNKSSAKWWTASIVAMISIIIISLFVDFWNDPKLTHPDEGIGNEITGNMEVDKNQNSKQFSTIDYLAKFAYKRILFYSMLIYGLIFSLRNYSSQMHNHVVNGHKASSIEYAGGILISSNIETKSKERIVELASKAIFTHQSSGYASKQSEKFNQNLIASVIDTAAGK